MRQFLGFLALLGTLSLALAPAPGPAVGHCGSHQMAADHGGHQHAPPEAPQDCPHCPASACLASLACGPAVAGLVTEVTAPNRVAGFRPGRTPTVPAYDSRTTEPGLPPPRLA